MIFRCRDRFWAATQIF